MKTSKYRWHPLLLFLTVFLLPVGHSCADTLTVASAANFQSTLNRIILLFEQATPHRVVPVYGSAGALFNQTLNGAPFDVFLSADEERPLLCVKKGLTIDSVPVTYAVGRLVLWAPRVGANAALSAVLDDSRLIAVAEPMLAVYGAAAMEYLRASGTVNAVAGKLVFGRDIAQTFQFVASKNAPAGFIALSQVLQIPEVKRGWYRVLPDSMYPPIRQCLVVLKRCHAVVPARQFVGFLTGAEARSIIESAGYARGGSR